MSWPLHKRAAGIGGGWAVALALGCHPKPRPSELPDDAAPPHAADASVRESAKVWHLAPPLAAAHDEGQTAVVARDRATGGVVLAMIDDARREVRVTELALAGRPDELELVASRGAFGLLAPAGADSGDARVLRRLELAPEGPRLGEAKAIGSASCAGGGGVFSLVREGSGWRRSFSPLAGEQVGVASSLLAAKAETTLVCGQDTAFVVMTAGGQARALAWAPGDHAGDLSLLPKLPDALAESEMSMAATNNQLVVARMAQQSLQTLVWSPGVASVWRATPLGGKGDAVLEAIEATPGLLGLLVTRTVDAAKGCKGGEGVDVVAEVAIVDTATGKLSRALERIETWRCGAEPGPFFSGWADGKFVVAWPRGADAACARAGVRHGGLGFAELDPRGGHVRVGRAGAPADSLAEAGCDGQRCFAVALVRGDDPCGPADGPASGELQVVAYPTAP